MEDEARSDRPTAQPNENSAERSRESGQPDESVDDQLGRMARDGFAALERFGLELEAALSGGFARATTASASGTSPDRSRSAESEESEDQPADSRAARAAARSQNQRERLAALETELRRRLIEEGLVVRGHDVARVVAVSTGQHVHWSI